jgi:hypothetical protein
VITGKWIADDRSRQATSRLSGRLGVLPEQAQDLRTVSTRQLHVDQHVYDQDARGHGPSEASMMRQVRAATVTSFYLKQLAVATAAKAMLATSMAG